MRSRCAALAVSSMAVCSCSSRRCRNRPPTHRSFRRFPSGQSTPAAIAAFFQRGLPQIADLQGEWLFSGCFSAFFKYSSLLTSISLIASTNASCKVSSLTVRAEQRILSSSLVLHRQTIVLLPRLFQCSLRKCSPQHSQVTMCEKAWFALNPCLLPFRSRSDDRRAISSCTLMNISFGMIAS